MNVTALQYPLKQQLRSVMIVSIVFVAIALLALFVRNNRALHGSSTTSNPSRAVYAHTPAIPVGSSPGSHAGRERKNPFEGFRNVSSYQ
jgi:hypothetical protein